MIRSNDEIRELLKDERRDRLNWVELLEFRSLLPIDFAPYHYCFDTIKGIFDDDLQESSNWIEVEKADVYRGTYYSFNGYYYKGVLFLASDCFTDGEDEWDEDDEIVDKVVAAEVLKIIMTAVSDYYVNQLLEE